ncbi:TetR/AcrR family transcriptional regulator [Nonomuraea sp. NEAU-A123]|uniref:TetR/AcrR family transcriptional regulator n=1 Tax=Nonomuraea sp. NEAU-A123 TaxID=2839649 RepID=UPI001BE48819|nr:TetR/AcrR family transcriptional regulator [Nonomuraea sp. NEAU-A123]MBT2227663.1 TetR/AcrR family transcriptional regulator [Nonomuraea sp. NEAU-A123]
MTIPADRNAENAAGPTAVVSRTGPKRSESIRLAVLNAADDLLVERGFNGVTIEGIAARAGVAKQTVYRWWKSKVDILLDTLADDARDALAWPGGGEDAEEELKAQLRRIAGFFQEPAGQVLRALLGHAQTDQATAQALREGFLREQRERDLQGLRAVLERHTGRPVAEPTVDTLLSVLLGPLYYQALVHGDPAAPELLDATARHVLDLALTSP